VGCGATPGALNFGTAQTTTGTVNYSCTNYDTFARTVNLCLGVGTSSYPGTVTQPALQLNGNALNYNLYRDSGYSQIWNTNSPITRSITIPANQTATGTFTYYARIGAGQTVPVGTYTGQLFNTRLGFVNAGTCQANVSDQSGVEFTINVSATVAAGCTLGTLGKIDFGSQPGLFTRADAAGSVQVTCPLSRAWTLKFDGGRNASAGTRRMRSSTGAYVPYGIYRDANRSNAIAIDGTIGGTGTGAVQTTPVYGRTQPASPPPIGTYQDFIVVTLSF
ncbi:MAG TPA: spore coat U domain-containing protein, partial [Croceibacterium sp.]|nr:spore coat U domain-containing protein [Croceibacterium sp.]